MYHHRVTYLLCILDSQTHLLGGLHGWFVFSLLDDTVSFIIIILAKTQQLTIWSYLNTFISLLLSASSNLLPLL